jgi:hypothetical protein
VGGRSGDSPADPTFDLAVIGHIKRNLPTARSGLDGDCHVQMANALVAELQEEVVAGAAAAVGTEDAGAFDGPAFFAGTVFVA